MTPRTWTLAALVIAAVVGLPLLARQGAKESTDAPQQTATVQETGPVAATGTTGECSGANPTAEACGPSPVAATAPPPRFVDLGTTTCAPCKAMLRVMDELEQQFPDALSVEFVNIKDDPDAMGRYGARMIPTQVFLSPDGIELYRHTGIFPTGSVITKWKELGYDLVALQDGRR